MRRLCVLLLMIIVCAVPAAAQKRPPGYGEAARQFESLAVDQRIRLQVLLTAAGYWSAVPNVAFNGRLFEAVQRFQRENGYQPSGRLDGIQVAHLIDAADPLLSLWNFRSVRHPFRDTAIWVPFGLGLQVTRDPKGWGYQEPSGRVSVGFYHFAQTPVAGGYASTLGRMLGDGTRIHYKILKDDFMVLSVTTPQGIDQYIRFHNDGPGSVGFILSWDSVAARDLHIERVATLMSASLWADRTGAAFIDPPRAARAAPDRNRDESGPGAEVIAPSPAHPEARAVNIPTPSAPKGEEASGPTSGTGFFVSPDGHALTNAHVVEACTNGVMVTAPGHAPTPARLVAQDKTNDLALLKTTLTPSRVAAFRTSVRLGEGIAVFGYPFAGVLSTSGNFTLGNVTALAGLGDDSRHLQISAPVQGGNSGGPLLDEHGNLIGVIVAKLNALRVMIATKGEVPQNVNFAIKASVAATFLDSHGVSPAVAPAGDKVDPADLADQAKAMSVYIVCDK
jgi:S1-C subfamily serine protease